MLSPELQAAITKLKQEKSLFLDKYEFKKGEFIEFIKNLSGIADLQEFSLTWSQLSGEDCQFLAEFLKKCTSLKTLNLEYNRIGDKGCKELAKVLKINDSLKTLNLIANQIGDEGFRILAGALKLNSTLITLNLSYNNISPGGYEMLAEALKVNSTLTSLNLEGNYGVLVDNISIREIESKLEENRKNTTVNPDASLTASRATSPLCQAY